MYADVRPANPPPCSHAIPLILEAHRGLAHYLPDSDVTDTIAIRGATSPPPRASSIALPPAWSDPCIRHKRCKLVLASWSMNGMGGNKHEGQHFTLLRPTACSTHARAPARQHMHHHHQQQRPWLGREQWLQLQLPGGGHREQVIT
jgi:hypothetical protein